MCASLLKSPCNTFNVGYKKPTRQWFKGWRLGLKKGKVLVGFSWFEKRGCQEKEEEGEPIVGEKGKVGKGRGANRGSLLFFLFCVH